MWIIMVNLGHTESHKTFHMYILPYTAVLK